MNFKNRLLGMKPSKKDNRDYLLDDIIMKSIYLPKSYKTKVPIIIKDQKDTSQCVACSLALMRYIQEYETNQSNNREDFSNSYIYASRINYDDMYKGEGMSPREALKCLKNYGVVHWSEFPDYLNYDEAVDLYNKNKNELDSNALPFRISTYYSLKNNTEIKKAIYKLGAVTAGFPVYDCLYEPDENGKIIFKKSDINGYHQMTIIGWTDDRYWIVANSWGTEFGDNGICYIPFDYLPIEAWAITDTVREIEYRMNVLQNKK